MVAFPLSALGLGLLIASPQLWQSLPYWFRSVRASQTAKEKMAVGNISFWHQLRQLIGPTTEPINGVFGTEAITFIGLPAFFCVFLAGWSWWWMVAGLSALLAAGRHAMVFRWTSWLHLRCPARYTYFMGLSLAFLAIEGFRQLPTRGQELVLLLQSGSLLFTLPRLWPMLPYCQRWERPGCVFNTPLTRFLTAQKPQGYRVSGLSYPLRTGQVNQIHTLGYNGASQAVWMAHFRSDPNTHGSGAHDWFALNKDGSLLDWYGVRYAYTYRLLESKWKPTMIPHLYENHEVKPMPSWKEVADCYGSVC